MELLQSRAIHLLSGMEDALLFEFIFCIIGDHGKTKQAWTRTRGNRANSPSLNRQRGVWTEEKCKEKRKGEENKRKIKGGENRRKIKEKDKEVEGLETGKRFDFDLGSETFFHFERGGPRLSDSPWVLNLLTVSPGSKILFPFHRGSETYCILNSGIHMGLHSKKIFHNFSYY